MQLTLRKFAPAVAVMALVLAGCTTPSKTGDKAAKPADTAQAATPAAASVVEFYIAQTQPGAGLAEVKVPDGSLYMERQPVLTRADLSEAAALVDRQGQNFVGLRFNESGARKLNDVSGKNVGKMLVLVIDRELVTAPRIAEPLNRGVLAFSVSSPQAAEAIAAKIRGEASQPAGAQAPAPGMKAPGGRAAEPSNSPNQ
ncbi:MAG: preprotein translocase subunit SecD [Bordetella sp.]|nr:preprotein translocase subunit SecD [Bordetella sp.]